jgi:hypothetical protein
MRDFYIANRNNHNNLNERKELAAAASRLKMHPSSEIAERYDELVKRIIPTLEKELDDAHDKYLSNVDLKEFVKPRIMTAIRKANRQIKGIEEKIRAAIKDLESAERATGYERSFQKGMIKDEKEKLDNLKEDLREATDVLDENKAELEDLKASFLASEKNHPAKVDELEAQLLEARGEVRKILQSVPAFKGGQTRARKNRVGTKRLRRK